jgi:tripartite-type tricarboxylate transporter receptor subunit TctC
MLRGLRMVSAGLISVATLGMAHAEDLTSVWRGKTVTVVVGTSAGGGYDLYARLFSRYLGKHLPGNPTVVVSNMPGAGSHLMAGYIAGVASKDGLWIGAPFSTQPLGPILDDAAQLRYDPRKLAYLGSADEDAFLCIIRKGAPIKTFDEAFKTTAIMAGTAETGSTGYLPVLLNNVLGTKFRPVVGYPGTREMTVAIEKGEADGMCGMNWSSINTQYKDLYKNGVISILVQERMTGHPDMDKLGIPKVGDYAKTDVQRSILNIIYSQQVFSRPYFVSGDVAPERVAALRTAFMETWKDPELLAEADKMGLEIGPISGQSLQEMLARIYENSPDLLAKTKDAIKFPR